MHDIGLLAPVRAGRPIEFLVSDNAWITAMLETEIALSAAQARLGLVPTDALADITVAARTHTFDTERIALASRGAANPVVVLVEELTRAVSDINPSSANYVHRGSTSQDILDTATMLIASHALSLIISDLDRTAASLARLARTYRCTPIAGRTLAMHAVPTTFGAKAATWLHGILDARVRLDALKRTGLPAQLGGAAGTLASYVECAQSAADRRPKVDALYIYLKLSTEFASQLSLPASVAPWHTVRTPIADLAGALAHASGALGKFATDVISLSRTEVFEVFEPAAAGRGESSAMPQKRNPALSTLIRSAALQVPALASVLFQSMIAEDERPAGAWHAEWQPLRECLLLVGGAADTAAELADGLAPDPQRMRDNLELTGGQIVSERLSIVLTPLLGKVAAKKALQAAAFESQRSGRNLASILSDDVRVRAHLTPDEIDELLVVDNYLGAAPAIIDRILDRYNFTVGAAERDQTTE